MMNELVVLFIVIAYLLGSFPTAFLVGKIVKGLDIREHGSGNVGATNVLRILGKKWGFLVLFIDVFKGGLGVLIARLFLSQETTVHYSWILLGTGLAAILGHIFPVWLKFKGGKGVAVGAGVFLILKPAEMAICLVVFLIILIITRYVSLSSVISTILLPSLIYINIFQRPWHLVYPFVVVSLFIALIVVIMHVKNFKRLINGTEHKIFSAKKDIK